MPHLQSIDDIRAAINHFEKRLSQLENERQTWEGTLRDLAENILPEYDRYDKQDNANRGDVDFSRILDTTATLASETLSAGMMSGVTNPARKWMKLSFPNIDLNQAGPVKQWLEEVNRIMLEIYAKSNLYNVLPSLYQELGVFGTAAIYVEADDDDVIRCYNFAPGEYYMATDEKGRTNTIYRTFAMTARQLVDQFGLNNVSMSVRSLARETGADQFIDVIHVIEPISEGQDLAIDKKIPFGSQFRSVYYEQGGPNRTSRRGNSVDFEAGNFLAISGYVEFPVMAPRWNTVSNDVYGYGRGHKCLGDIKQLQHQTEIKLEAVEKQTRPPLVAPVGTNPGQISTLPDHISYFNTANGNAGIGAMYQVNLDMNSLREDISVLQERINRYFYVDAFRMFSQLSDGGVKTATETIELKEEKLLALGSVLQRINDELLDPLTDRVFGLALRAGMIPPPPEEIEGFPIRVEYLSILAEAQKAQGVGVMERLINFAGLYAQATGGDTAMFDKIDSDDLLDKYSDAIGAPASSVKSTEDAQAERAARQRVAQAQQSSELANLAADTAQKLDQTSTDDDTQLQRVMENINAATGN